MTTLTQRLLRLINMKADGRRPYKAMHELTGIAADRWSAVFAERQRPTVDMIEGVSKLWPQHAFWLTTGIEDSEAGHTDPSMREQFSTWEIEDVSEELFRMKLSRREPAQLHKALGQQTKKIGKRSYDEHKNFFDLFDDDGFISKLNVTVKLVSWLSKEGAARQEWELEQLRLLVMQNAPMGTRSEEVFFDYKSAADSSRLRLIEPYRSEIQKLKKMATESKESNS